MAPGISFSITVLFLLTVAAVYLWLVSIYGISMGRKGWWLLTLITIWLAVQAVLSLNGFYRNDHSIPPHFLLAVGLPFILVLVFTRRRTGNKIPSLPLLPLTLLHSCRLPVEIVLWKLYGIGLIPRIMTFEGGNLDILAGITAPVIAYLWLQKRIGRRGLLYWNYAALLLLLNIIVRAALSAPTVFQRLAFDQPNLAVAYFPFVWLPAFIVPVVLYCHLAIIYELWDRR